MRVALDTNVLAYAEGVNDAVKRRRALDLLHTLPEELVVVPVQVLGELFNVLVLKAGRSRSGARLAIMSWRDTYQLIETSPKIMMSAADLATDHELRIWDSVIMAAASEAGCRLLLSEDLQDGFTWGGVTVLNPFTPMINPMLEGLLQNDPP